MSKSNLAASIKQRLKNYAKEKKEGFNPVLVRFGLERLFDQFLLLAIDPTGKEHHHQMPRLQKQVSATAKRVDQ